MLENRVDFYTEGIARFPVYFPNGKTSCRYCRFCWHKEAFGLYVCRLTDEYIEKADLNARNRLCPIEFYGGEENGELL